MPTRIRFFGVDSVPFLATSYADAAKLWKASRKGLDDRFEKQGLKILYAVPWPPAGYLFEQAARFRADMKGLKMRTYNPATSRVAELLGAQPVTIQAGGAAQAMATGAGQREHHLRGHRL
jgi:TRAP-type C4-dicarboxylate transport system substrate-binding protein